MCLCVGGGSEEVNYVLLRLLSRARNLCIYKFPDMWPVYSGYELYQNQHDYSDVTHCCTYNLPFRFPCYAQRRKITHYLNVAFFLHFKHSIFDVSHAFGWSCSILVLW